MEFFHVLSRGVDKRKIFIDKQDYLRFIHNLFEFNDKEYVNNNFYCFNYWYSGIKKNAINNRTKPRKLLVDIYAFCLMPNHYHLLLSSVTDGGISQFMKKVNIGYAKYFNQKYDRKGTLFEGRFKSVLIKSEKHFIYIPFYIHMNPLDLISPEWRRREINDYKKAINFLENYRWSSHLDYLGKNNFPSVIKKDFLLEFFGGTSNYRKNVYEWLKEMDITGLENIFLE